MCSDIWMLIQHQKLGFRINILKMRSRKSRKTREHLASDEMAYDIRKYIDSLKHDPSWVRINNNDINKLPINCEYIELFIQIYIQ